MGCVAMGLGVADPIGRFGSVEVSLSAVDTKAVVGAQDRERASAKQAMGRSSGGADGGAAVGCRCYGCY